MKCLLSCMLVISLFSSTACLANGSTLLAECKELEQFAETGILDNTSSGASYCMGMVSGMMSLNAVYRAQGTPNPLFCPPAVKITNGRGARLVIDYLEQHPELIELDAGSLMLFAFQQAFPCTGK